MSAKAKWPDIKPWFVAVIEMGKPVSHSIESPDSTGQFHDMNLDEAARMILEMKGKKS